MHGMFPLLTAMHQSFLFIFFPILTRILGDGIGEVWFWTPNNGHYSAYNNPTVYTYYTNLLEYEFITGDTVELSFSVKSYGTLCSVAFLFLSPSPSLDSSEFYEIFLGGDRTIIRKKFQKDEYAQTYTPIPYTCDDFRDFYLKIENGQLTLETTGGNQVLNWIDPQPLNISGLGIKTGYGDSGLWKFKHKGEFSGFFCGKINTFGYMSLLNEGVAESQSACAALCTERNECLGFNVDVHLNKCQLISTGQVVVTTLSTNWKFFTKCLDNRKMCLACMTTLQYTDVN